MDKAREFLEKSAPPREATDLLSSIAFSPEQGHKNPSFYEYFIFRGIRVNSVQPGSKLSFSFTVPPRLTDSDGKLAMGAIASLVDEIGAAVIQEEGRPMAVSVDMSISYISDAKMNDELEIITTFLGRQGGYNAAHVLIRNKTTGEIVAEGRHSLFHKPKL